MIKYQIGKQYLALFLNMHCLGMQMHYRAMSLSILEGKSTIYFGEFLYSGFFVVDH